MSIHTDCCRAALLAVVTGTLSAQDWTQLTPSPSPLGRQDHAMAYDALSDRVVLFGGQANGNFLPPQTWEWDGAHWLQQSTPTAPAARESPAMANDSQRGVSVLFGGLNSSGVNGDTWEWATGSWTLRATATHPPARYLHAMVHDALRGRVVLFGGFGGSSALNDTWEWDGATWSHPLPPSSPAPRWATALAFDSQRGVAVLFGGFDNTNQMGDTWQWNGTAWTQSAPAHTPGARNGHAMVGDALRQRVLLFGGYRFGEQGDSWSWDGTDWTQLLPAVAPPARTGHALAYDSRRGSTLLFGGSVAGTALGDTWVHALAAARAFGAGCGAPPLLLQPGLGSLPLLGQAFTSQLAVPPAALAVFLAAGFSDRAIGALTLPLDLGPFGLPGCSLYQDLFVLGLPCQLVGGTATQSLAIPNAASLAGLRVFLQGWAGAPGVNAAGLLTSNALELTLGH